MTDAPCECLEWDSAFFGWRIARVTTPRLSAAAMNAVLDWCRSQRISTLYWLADGADAPSVRAAERAGFRLVDIRVELDRPLAVAPPVADQTSHRIRRATANDIPVLRGIARSAFGDSRFFHDDRFPRKACERLYETWIENSIRGYADIVLVSTGTDDVANGFITGHAGREEARIGLVGVDLAARGKGVGRALTEAACQWAAERGHPRISVPTQARNIPAIRLYERCGFLARATTLWYHLWLDA